MKYTIPIRIIKSIFENIENLILEHLAIPFLLTLVAFCVWTLILIKGKKLNFSNLKKAAPFFLLFFYACFVLEITIISRVGVHYDAFDKLFGDWSVFDTSYYMYINFTPIVNILLFFPLAALYYFCFKDSINKVLLKRITIISFAASMLIELIQLTFRIGTFQISDLVYNTLGGIIGFLALLIVKVIYRKIKMH